jgi:hypothetical protein
MRFSRAVTFLGTSLVFVIELAGTALAEGHGHHHGWGHGWGHAPEIDPSLIGSGLALLGGSFLLFIERYRRRK